MTRLLIIFFANFLVSTQPIFEFSSVENENAFNNLTQEIGCPLCSGSSISESDSEIARDLKKIIYLEVEKGSSEENIKDFLVNYYGEEILFMPRNATSQYILFSFPLILLSLGVLILRFLKVKNK